MRSKMITKLDSWINVVCLFPLQRKEQLFKFCVSLNLLKKLNRVNRQKS